MMVVNVPAGATKSINGPVYGVRCIYSQLGVASNIGPFSPTSGAQSVIVPSMNAEDGELWVFPTALAYYASAEQPWSKVTLNGRIASGLAPKGILAPDIFLVAASPEDMDLLGASAGGALDVATQIAGFRSDNGWDVLQAPGVNSDGAFPVCGRDKGGVLRTLLPDSAGRMLVGSGTQQSDLSFASPAAVGTTVLAGALLGLDAFRSAAILARLQGGTGGTLDVYLQTSFDGGASWMDMVHFAQLAAGAALVAYATSANRSNGGIVTVNALDNAPSIPASNSESWLFGNALRVVAVAGAGTTAGAQQTIKALFSA